MRISAAENPENVMGLMSSMLSDVPQVKMPPRRGPSAETVAAGVEAGARTTWHAPDTPAPASTLVSVTKRRRVIPDRLSNGSPSVSWYLRVLDTLTEAP